MTIIAAKQYWKPWEEKKWTLFTDDCITIGQSQVSAAKKYRPKLREINWKNYNLIIASCWGTREIDFILNLLEAKLEIEKTKDTIGLGYIIQTTLVEARKTLWEISKDPSVWLLILETNTNTLWHTDDFSMFRVPDEWEIVAGSWEQAFLSASRYEGFLESLRSAVKTDEYCEFPIYAYRDWEIHSFYSYHDTYEMLQILDGNQAKNELTPTLCNEEYREPKWMSENIATKLW